MSFIFCFSMGCFAGVCELLRRFQRLRTVALRVFSVFLHGEDTEFEKMIWGGSSRGWKRCRDGNRSTGFSSPKKSRSTLLTIGFVGGSYGFVGFSYGFVGFSYGFVGFSYGFVGVSYGFPYQEHPLNHQRYLVFGS